MYTVKVEDHFSAAHIIEGHPKCGRLHGHNYVVEWTIKGRELEPSGMFVDFGVMKQVLKEAVDYLDHRFLFPVGDIDPESKTYKYQQVCEDDFVDLPVKSSTAENLAKLFALQLVMQLHKVVKKHPHEFMSASLVTIKETPNSEATYEMSV